MTGRSLLENATACVRKMTRARCVAPCGTDAVRAGKPNYDEMTPWFADLVKQTVHLYQSEYANWGGVQFIEFRRVGTLGDDEYEVRQEHAVSYWTIVLNSNGLIADARNLRPEHNNIGL
jgi:hypothetical protein